MNILVHSFIAKLWIGFVLLVLVSMPFASAQQASVRGSSETNVRQAGAVIPLPKSKSDGLTRPGEAYPKDRSASPTGASGLLGSFFALGMVLVVFFGFVLIAKRVWPSVSSSRMPREVFEVLASSELQPKQTWMLMRFGSKILLVCQQPGQTQLISEISDQAEIQRIVSLCNKPRSSESDSPSFSWQSLFSGQQ
ncbi:MAG: flagellar biosynthetic protein FliO [Pirellula sp.]